MRPAGSKNKPKEISEVLGKMTNEDAFLAELIKGKAKWANIAAELDAKGHNNEKELDYSEAYKVLINRFTQIEASPQQ